MATPLVLTPGPTQDSYGSLASYQQFVEQTYNIKLATTAPTATGRPTTGSTLTTQRDYITSAAGSLRTINAGGEHAFRGFTLPSTVTTGVTATDDGLVIATEGIYGAEVRSLPITISDCEAGTLTVKLVVADDNAGRLEEVPTEIAVPAISSAQVYIVSDLTLRQRTLPANSHMYIEVSYSSDASGADMQFTLGMGNYSVTRYAYTGGTPGSAATSGVTVDSPAAQEAQLRQAGLVLNTFQWKYMPLMADQRLQFPVSIDGVSSGIPPKLIEAQFKIANAIREGKVGLHSGSASDRNETIRNQGTVTRYGLPGVSIERRTGLVTSSISDHIGTTNDELQSNWPDLHILLREYLDDTSVAGEGSWAR